MIRQCVKCKWTFEHTHSDQCPQCGRDTVEHDELHQGSWLAFKRKEYDEELDKIASKVQCCWTSKHTRGFHHDSNCPKYAFVD